MPITFDKNKAGRFRGNPEASALNNLRLKKVDSEEGTPQQDSGTITKGVAIDAEGIQYTGFDTVSVFIPFFKQTIPDGERIDQPVKITDGADALQAALNLAISAHEVDPVITVVDNGATYDVVHIGAGTLESITLDGTAQALTRGAIP